MSEGGDAWEHFHHVFLPAKLLVSSKNLIYLMRIWFEIMLIDNDHTLNSVLSKVHDNLIGHCW